MPAKTTFATRLRSLRAERGHTQEALAAAAGISREYLARLETARFEPSWEVVQRLAKALEIKTDSFIA